jgi:sulfur transfer complex TusBCD TusB component (DsrH family)
MKILHIIRNPYDTTPIEIAKSQGTEHDVALLLMHDAVYMDPGMKAYACRDDADARGITVHECVAYDRIIKMIFEYDRVVSW